MGRVSKSGNPILDPKLEEEELQNSKGGRNNGTREVIYEAKKRKKDKCPVDTHEATFSVVISMGIPSSKKCYQSENF